MRRLAASFLIFLCFCAFAAGVIKWQLDIAQGAPIQLEKTERMDAVQGVCGAESLKFFYFYYYLNLLPVTAPYNPDQFWFEGAKNFVAKNGALLSNDVNSACAVGRLGDWGKFFLYLPNAWLKQTAQHPSMILATTALFIGALIAVLAAAFAQRRFLLGLAVIVLVGSYKIQLFWSYFADNIQGVLITSTLLLLAVNFRFVCQRRVPPLRRDWMIAISSGLILGCIQTVRGDPLPLAVSIVLMYLFSGQRLKRRAALSAVFVCSLWAVCGSFDAYFEYKSRQSQAFITSVGGTIYAGEPELRHTFWHPIAAGLGDFGRDRGFLWEDGVIYKMALPRVNQKMGRQFVEERYFFVEPSMRPEQYLKPETMKEYGEALREIVIATIRDNPRWYLNILKNRVLRLLESMQKIRIGWNSGEVILPFPAWMIAVVIGISLIFKRYEYLKLILFVVPTAFVPVVIFSGLGTVFLSIIHLVVAAALVEATVLAVCALIKKGIVDLGPAEEKGPAFSNPF